MERSLTTMVGFTSHISIVFLLLLSATTFHRSICSSKSDLRCNGKDHSALLKFKQRVIDHSNKLSSWSSEDCCAWKGVKCDNITGRVTKLVLQQEHLEGEINLSLFDLEFLNYLDLSLNDFTGLVIPSNAHANLSKLQYLDLSYNDDLQMANLHWLSPLSSLKCLNLSLINLQNETNWLQSMAMMHPSLLELRLASSHLTNISPLVKYVNFTSLVTLDLSGNYFDSELPYWLFNLSTDISHIDLGFNNLQGQIPKSLLNLRKLKTLRLNNNELDGSIPDWLGQHENLQYLSLSDNLFHGFFPSTLGNLSSLVDLAVSSDFLSGNLSSSIGQLYNLRSLFIGGSFSGVLSEKHFSKLYSLESLALNSAFAFDLGPHWIPPFQLRLLELRNTILGPNFPSWIYTQRALESLDVSSTGISFINGDMFWSFIANIRQILLSYNAISADLSNVTLNSDIIFMNHNNFTGGLPHLSENVLLIDASSNSLSGPIDPLLCHKSGGENILSYLDISYNQLAGSIPDCWENWKGLSFLFFDTNNLTGEIPPSMGSLHQLIEMNLHNNTLSGKFPLDLSNLNTLVFINLGQNNFSGAIPVKMPQSMQVMILNSNQFSGNIPPQLCTLSSLIHLDLSQNKLSGHIPQCLYNITPMDAARNLSHFKFKFNLFWKGQELEYQDTGLLRNLDLSGNNLSGEIPPELFGLTQLQFLNLSHNHFLGKIARRIGGMKNLESLDLSNNYLSGEIPESLSNLSFLSYLNLSYNDFTGPIPLGTQLQSFDAWSYVGNPELCGAPLTKNCTEEDDNLDKDAKQSGENEDDEFKESLYLGMGVGFAVGFWGICGSLFLNRAWRHTYFRFFDHIKDQFYLIVTLKFNKVRGIGARSSST